MQGPSGKGKKTEDDEQLHFYLGCNYELWTAVIELKFASSAKDEEGFEVEIDGVE